MDIKEEWKPVKNYEEFYDISNIGRIRNHKTKEILKDRKNNRGYHMLNIYGIDKEGNPIHLNALVHRLLAESFLDDTGINPDGTPMNGKHQVNHKDGNKDNNVINNLEWCDQSYNMREAYKLELRKYIPHEVTEEYREKMRILSSKPAPGKEIQMLDKNTQSILHTFDNAVEAAKYLRSLGIKAIDSGIRDAANHRRGAETYKGYKWKFTGNITNGNKCREFNPDNKKKKVKR